MSTVTAIGTVPLPDASATGLAAAPAGSGPRTAAANDASPAVILSLSTTATAAPRAFRAEAYSFIKDGSTYTLTPLQNGMVLGTKDGRAWKAWRLITFEHNQISTPTGDADLHLTLVTQPSGDANALLALATLILRHVPTDLFAVAANRIDRTA
jgi:hypothetical protein